MSGMFVSKALLEELKQFEDLNTSLIDAVGVLRQAGEESHVAEMSHFIEEMGHGHRPIICLLTVANNFLDSPEAHAIPTKPSDLMKKIFSVIESKINQQHVSPAQVPDFIKNALKKLGFDDKDIKIIKHDP